MAYYSHPIISQLDDHISQVASGLSEKAAQELGLNCGTRVGTSRIFVANISIFLIIININMFLIIINISIFRWGRV